MEIDFCEFEGTVRLDTPEGGRDERYRPVLGGSGWDRPGGVHRYLAGEQVAPLPVV